MTAAFLILGILPFLHQAVFPSPVVMFTLLAIPTNICYLWTVATSWEQYNFTSICHLSETQWRPQISHKSNVSPVSLVPPCRDSLLCSHYMVLLENKQVTCAENQHHPLCRLAKYTNRGTMTTMPRNTFGKRTVLQILNNNTVVETVLKLFTSILVQRSSTGALVKSASLGNGASCYGDVK
jgi:hypothetical protein